MLSIIVAVSDNNVIVKNNKNIWHLPEDLKRFKELTTGHTIIMGRKTFESLGRVLPNRKHIVITRDTNYNVDNPNVKIVNNIEDIENYIESDEESFVIGGAIIYRQLMDKVDKMYVTRIHEKFDGDAYFPIINEQEWEEKEVIKGIKNEKNSYDYEFITYVRKNKK